MSVPESPMSNTLGIKMSETEMGVLSMIEHIANLDCQLLLKHIELALVTRNSSHMSVFISAYLFFSSIELLEFSFRCHEMGSISSIGWCISDPPSLYIEKVESFAHFMQDLIRCRHIVEPLQLDSSENLLITVTAKDIALGKLVEELQLGKP
jgi:hypothetical protein